MTVLHLTPHEAAVVTKTVLKAAGKAGTAPFDQVLLTVRSGAVWALATDRYRICRTRIRSTSVEPYDLYTPAAWWRVVDRMYRTCEVSVMESAATRSISAYGRSRSAGIGWVGFSAILENKVEPLPASVWEACDRAVRQHPDGAVIGIGDSAMPPAAMFSGRVTATFVSHPGHEPFAYVSETDGGLRTEWIGMPRRQR